MQIADRHLPMAEQAISVGRSIAAQDMRPQVFSNGRFAPYFQLVPRLDNTSSYFFSTIQCFIYNQLQKKI